MLILLQKISHIFQYTRVITTFTYFMEKLSCFCACIPESFSSKYFVAKKGRVRDIETEEMLEELQGKVRELDRQNNQLKEKVL